MSTHAGRRAFLGVCERKETSVCRKRELIGFNGRPSGGQSDLASVYDISLDRQLNARAALSLYLAMARGGGVIQNIFREGSNARFGFIEVTNRF